MPRTLSGKKMELPVKKLLMGTPAEQVFKRDAMANAERVDWFVAFASRRLGATTLDRQLREVAAAVEDQRLRARRGARSARPRRRR